MSERELFLVRAQRHQDMIYRLALTYTKNPHDAEDITQEVLIKLYTSKTDFQSEDHVRFWLVRVTQNECRKKYRRAREITVSLDEVGEIASEDGDERRTFAAVMELDRKYRQIIILYYYEDYSIEEISKLTRIPKGTVGTRLSRGREILKKKLEEGG